MFILNILSAHLALSDFTLQDLHILIKNRMGSLRSLISGHRFVLILSRGLFLAAVAAGLLLRDLSLHLDFCKIALTMSLNMHLWYYINKIDSN